MIPNRCCPRHNKQWGEGGVCPGGVPDASAFPLCSLVASLSPLRLENINSSLFDEITGLTPLSPCAHPYPQICVLFPPLQLFADMSAARRANHIQAQGNALGKESPTLFKAEGLVRTGRCARPSALIIPSCLVPRAMPWARLSQPVGLKHVDLWVTLSPL